MIEPKLTITKLTRSLRFHHPCRVCGYPHAAFGRKVNLSALMKLRATSGEVRKELLGEWECGIDGCVNLAGI